MFLRNSIYILFVFAISSGWALGQTETAAPAAAPAVTEVVPENKVDSALKLMLSSPRDCFNTFRRSVAEGNWEEAKRCMDFSGFETRITEEHIGNDLAHHLYLILRSVELQAFLLPDKPDHDEVVRLSAYARDPLTFEYLEDSMRADFDLIVISKNDDGLWRFDPGSVKQIEVIYDRRKPELATLAADNSPKTFATWLEQQFPMSLRKKRFLFYDYVWICLAAVIALGFIADAAVCFLTLSFSQNRLGDEATDAEHEEKEEAVRWLWKPVGLLVQALVWYYGSGAIGLPSWAIEKLTLGLRIFAVLAGVWVLFRLIDICSAYLAKRAEKTESRYDDLLIPLLSKCMKVLAIVLGLIICAETFSLPIGGLLGGLGIGGMALALASKDAVSNLFGSFTVLMDRPFEIGDWVITEDIEGTVEQVGFRSTRIRTFYNSLITLPNSRLTTAVVDNMGRRRYRRVKTTLGVNYNTTPEQMDAFCEGIRELIRRNRATRKDYFHVYFSGFGESSLDIMIYFFLRVPDWSMELKERHKIFAEILRLAQELNVGFAFPTRTLHMHSESETPRPYSLPHQNAEIFGRESAARIAQGVGETQPTA